MSIKYTLYPYNLNSQDSIYYGKIVSRQPLEMEDIIQAMVDCGTRIKKAETINRERR